MGRGNPRGKRPQFLPEKQNSHHKRPLPTGLMDGPNEVGKLRPRALSATPGPAPASSQLLELHLG